MELVKEIKDYKLILGLIVLQLLVTVPFIDSAPICNDEPFSIFYAQQKISEFIPFLNTGNNPPLHFILLHYIIEIFGSTASSVRSLSLLFNILTIPVLYNFGKQFLNKKETILLIGFFIFSTFNHYHAIEARVYSLMVLLTVLIFYEIYKLIFLQNFNFIMLAIWNVLLMYSHYLGGIVILLEIILLVVFYFKMNKQKIIYFILSGIISLILFLPMILLLFERIGDFSTNGTWVSKPHLSELYGNIVRFLNAKYSVLMIGGVVLIIIIKNYKLIVNDKLKGVFSHKNIFIFLIFGLSYFGIFIFSILKQPIFIDRYLLFITPFLFLSLIIIIKYLLFGKKNNLVLISLIIPMIIFCEYLPDTNRNPNEMTKFVLNNQTDNSKILISPPFYELTFLYHFNNEIFKDYKNLEKSKKTNGIHSIYSFNNLTKIKFGESFFFIDAKSELMLPNNEILNNLQEEYLLKEVRVFDGRYRIYYFLNKRK